MLISALLYFSFRRANPDNKNASAFNVCVTEGRASVTFIMGVDKPNTNDFYKNATYFYNMHPAYKTDFVIHSQLTLADVLRYLTASPANKSYSTVNIVCHGNPWQGLRVAVDKNIPRATLPQLNAALKNGLISPLCSPYIDDLTKINIISCGVGQNRAFSEILNQLFKCRANNKNPNVRVDKHYINFTNKMNFTQSEFYFVASKYDYNDPNVISGKLKLKYKDIPINWKKAYQNTIDLETNEPYKHRFRMLIEWKIGFNNENEIPDFKNDTDILTWIKTQNNAMQELEQMKLKPEDFMWHSLPVNDQPISLRIKGYGNVEGVMINLPSDGNTNEATDL